MLFVAISSVVCCCLKASSLVGIFTLTGPLLSVRGNLSDIPFIHMNVDSDLEKQREANNSIKSTCLMLIQMPYLDNLPLVVQRLYSAVLQINSYSVASIDLYQILISWEHL